MIRTLAYCFAFTVCTICPAWSSPFEIVDFSSEISAQIYQPDPAEAHVQKAIPTLYIMDGQHFIYSAIGYQLSLNWRNPTSPRFIMVAVDTINGNVPKKLCIPLWRVIPKYHNLLNWIFS